MPYASLSTVVLKLGGPLPNRLGTTELVFFALLLKFNWTFTWYEVWTSANGELRCRPSSHVQVRAGERQFPRPTFTPRTVKEERHLKNHQPMLGTLQQLVRISFQLLYSVYHYTYTCLSFWYPPSGHLCTVRWGYNMHSFCSVWI